MKLNWKLTTDNGTFEGSHELVPGENHIVVTLPACRIEEAQARGTVRLSDNEKIYMNGYQTWTASPEYDRTSRQRGLRGVPARVIEQFSFDRYGDYHFINYTNRPGILHGFS